MALFLKFESLQLILEMKGALATLHLFKIRLIKDRRTLLTSTLSSNPKDYIAQMLQKTNISLSL